MTNTHTQSYLKNTADSTPLHTYQHILIKCTNTTPSREKKNNNTLTISFKSLSKGASDFLCKENEDGGIEGSLKSHFTVSSAAFKASPLMLLTYGYLRN